MGALLNCGAKIIGNAEAIKITYGDGTMLAQFTPGPLDSNIYGLGSVVNDELEIRNSFMFIFIFILVIGNCLVYVDNQLEYYSRQANICNEGQDNIIKKVKDVFMHAQWCHTQQFVFSYKYINLYKKSVSYLHEHLMYFI